MVTLSVGGEFNIWRLENDALCKKFQKNVSLEVSENWSQTCKYTVVLCQKDTFQMFSPHSVKELKRLHFYPKNEFLECFLFHPLFEASFLKCVRELIIQRKWVINQITLSVISLEKLYIDTTGYPRKNVIPVPKFSLNY